MFILPLGISGKKNINKKKIYIKLVVLFNYIYWPGVAGAVLQTPLKVINSFSNWSFSWNHLHYLNVWARDLKFFRVFTSLHMSFLSTGPTSLVLSPSLISNKKCRFKATLTKTKTKKTTKKVSFLPVLSLGMLVGGSQLHFSWSLICFNVGYFDTDPLQNHKKWYLSCCFVDF